MAVILSRSNSVSEEKDVVSLFRRYIEGRAFDGYCGSTEYQALVHHAVLQHQFNEKMAEQVLDLELERLCVANEKKLLSELELALLRSTRDNKKLGEKERLDARQLVCRPRSGFRKGLDVEVADEAITTYCRRNSVKLKHGIFSWAIP